jgi:hypothetical protein
VETSWQPMAPSFFPRRLCRPTCRAHFLEAQLSADGPLPPARTGPTASAHPDQLTAWQPYGATLAPAPNANEGARNANDREVNARPHSGCARFNDRLRELWPRGMRCD